MRVGLFFDGQNFYSGWRDMAAARRIDFARLARWMVQRVEGKSLWGAHYYTYADGTPAQYTDSQQKLSGFLDVLETQPGYFVHRFNRRANRPGGCPQCATTRDKELDTHMVADMVRDAASGAFDAMVLLSGDGDFTPAVDAVRALGKQAHVASWGGTGVAQRLRRAAFEHIDLLEGLPEFEREEDMGLGRANPLTHGPVLDRFLGELLAAEAKFAGGYVGLGYFITKWRSPSLDPDPDQRRKLLDQLVHEGRVEMYLAPDGAQAIRSSQALAA
jgi:uncharacterized LabA/DUF88 family protein